MFFLLLDFGLSLNVSVGDSRDICYSAPFQISPCLYGLIHEKLEVMVKLRLKRSIRRYLLRIGFLYSW